MSNYLTLIQDMNGDLWYKHFKIEKISFDEAAKIGHLYGTDPSKNSTIFVSMSATPKIEFQT